MEIILNKRTFVSFGFIVGLSSVFAHAATGSYDGNSLNGDAIKTRVLNSYSNTLNVGSNTSGNIVSMTGSNNRFGVGNIFAAYSNNTLVSNNKAILNTSYAGKIGYLIGGFTNNGLTTKNMVELTSGTVLLSAGGLSIRGDAIDNNLLIDGGTADWAIGGLSAFSDASKNNVVMESGRAINIVAGGYTQGGDATSNTLTMSGGNSNNTTVGGYVAAGNGNSTDNHITISGGTSNNAFGGFANSGNAISNSVLFQGGTISNLLAGGYSPNGNTISNNTVLVEGGTTSAGGTLPNIAGGFSQGGATVENNITIITGATSLSGATVGGYSRTGSATNNRIEVSGGTFTDNSIVAGGYTNTGSATNNNVFLKGGTFGTDSIIAGGYSSGNGSVTGNTVIIDNPTALTLANVGLRGGVSTGGIVADNRLVIKSAVSVASVAGFEHLEFHIQNHDTAAMLTATNMTTGIDITATKNVEIYIADRIETLRNGDQIKLLVGATLITGTADNIEITAAQGFHVLYDLEYRDGAGGTGRHLAVTNASAHPHSRSFVEGRLASFAFMNQGTDLIVGQGISSALSATEATSGNWAGFTALSVGSSHYDTGGKAYGLVNFEGFSMLVGLSKSINLNLNNLMIGAFFEVGDGSIDALNRFSNGTEINTDGTSTYYGGGILGRFDHKSGLYTEGFIRVGTLDTSYTTDDIRFAVSHDTSSLYYGAGIGLGYQFKGFNENDNIDLYGRYSWVVMEEEDVVIDSTDYFFEDINSHQVRLGVRYNHKNTDYIFPYFGVAYEYEFDGDANGTVAGNLDLTTPSLEGNTGVLEIGVQVISESNIPLSLSFDVEGYIGEREGVTGNIELVYSF